ncbi:hypothetical protein Bca52824_019763 [Brassica carinata]|uniref:Uncharacterized protein n=1 Tax=Brassica carinata TaxID=52824 RepID=A0A8X7VSC7_BRACI|nr:hypothetical protein Bca52824_019763 [Brassica carinata]
MITSRSSSASKRFCSSSSPEPSSSSPRPTKRFKVKIDASIEFVRGTGGVFVGERADTNPEADVLATPTIAVVTDGEKSKAGKERAKAPWEKLLSQYPQNPHHILRGPVFTVGRRGCDLSIKDQSMPSTLTEVIGSNSRDIGLEEDDGIHEKIVTSVSQPTTKVSNS